MAYAGSIPAPTANYMNYRLYKTKIFILMLFLGIITPVIGVYDRYLIDYTFFNKKTHHEPCVSSSKVIEIYQLTNKTTFTGYSLSIDETDKNPCIGSGNNNLCKLSKELKNKGQTICASRDLPLDTLIYIDGFGECVIKDRMNIRYKGTNIIDILFNNKQDAINFGLKKLKYVVVK